MADLLAIGSNSKDWFRKTIPEQTLIRIGRAPRSGWRVPWDPAISREHVDLQLTESKLQVKRLGTSRNPVVYLGKARDEFEMAAGEEFQIGRTVFRFLIVHFESGPNSPVAERSFPAAALQKAPISKPDLKLEILSRLPPLISEARSDADLAKTIVDQLLEAIPDAGVASVIRNSESGDPRQDEPDLLFWNSQSDTDLFRPSRKLLSRSLELRASVLHLWNQDLEPDESRWTKCGDLDWAFSVPVGGASRTDWCIYVAGRTRALSSDESTQTRLQGDMRFAELLAEFIRAIRTVRVLERRHVQMGQFFSPAVVETLITAESEKRLEPRTQDATVLFCDLRGFSRKVEQAREGLYTLLCRVSDALGVMTRNIMKYEGVIADFQGDAALGFWGWPSFSSEDPLSACRAALAMLSEFRQADGQQDHALAGFKVGIGICHGTAIAGKIGTNEQAKVGVFGPVVNLAARLESLTQQCGVPILIDEATARHVREHLGSEARCRRVARVRPVGVDSAVMVSELLPSASELECVTASHLQDYEKALDGFIQGRWQEARDWLDRVPGDDGAKQFLTAFQAKHQWQPPEDWDGVITLDEK